MVDCADRERIDEARQELHRIANDREMKDAVVLIFANKQDLPQGVCVCAYVFGQDNDYCARVYKEIEHVHSRINQH